MTERRGDGWRDGNNLGNQRRSLEPFKTYIHILVFKGFTCSSSVPVVSDRVVAFGWIIVVVCLGFFFLLFAARTTYTICEAAAQQQKPASQSGRYIDDFARSSAKY